MIYSLLMNELEKFAEHQLKQSEQRISKIELSKGLFAGQSLIPS